MATKTIGVFVGSLRKGSFSKQLAQYIASAMPGGFTAELIDISEIPMYNEDLDDGSQTPAAWARLREDVKRLDGFLFVTPEYNRSVPAVLKNALDVASRPYGQNAWGGKPGAIISISPGSLGAFGANHHLRQTMVFLNIYMMQQPEAYIGNVGAMFDDSGNIKEESTRNFLADFAAAFGAWVNRFA